MAGESNCTAGTSALFLRQLRTYHPEPLSVIWDNAPAHHGAALRTSLATPALHLRLVPVPGDSPDVTADAASWDWVRDEVTANTCLGTKPRSEREALAEPKKGIVGEVVDIRLAPGSVPRSSTAGQAGRSAPAPRVSEWDA